jgi:cysteinyl-tRNA synthetase
VIQIYDTLRRTRRPLSPRTDGLVRLYVCGPTVYDDCHIGHLMGPVIFDSISRWLRARGFAVRFVNNITDIDDKIIQRALRTKEDWRSIAVRYTEQYFQHLRDLSVVTITDHPRCTEYVPQMLRFVADLIAKDRAYVTSDGVYYDVHRQPDYGKLSGRKVEDMIAGARVEASAELRHPADFALWKAAKPGEPTWDSPFGPGRPGWHLECSVMARELLGEAFDIHGGGDDLKFPHHENEIAQSEAHGDHFADCWMHHGLVQYGGRKVAKSDPRMQDPQFAQQFKASWLIEHHGAPALRFFLLRGHYRRPIDFEPQNLEAARTGLVRLLKQLGDLLDEEREVPLGEILAAELPDVARPHREAFCAAMDDDFNTGEAIAALFALAAVGAERNDLADRRRVLEAVRDLGRCIGLFQAGDLAKLAAARPAGERVSKVANAVLALRMAARARKDFATADALRDALTGSGIVVKDGAGGATFDAPSDESLAPLLAAVLALHDRARAGNDEALAQGIREALQRAGVTVHADGGGSRWE